MRLPYIDFRVRIVVGGYVRSVIQRRVALLLAVFACLLVIAGARAIWLADPLRQAVPADAVTRTTGHKADRAESRASPEMSSTARSRK